MATDDDLPRTLRREREAREREAREREARELTEVAPVMPVERRVPLAMAASGAVVTDFDVPFSRLMSFFIKAVFAAIPAMLMLIALLWLFGQGLQTYFPQLLKLKILIYVPQ
jgi:hypothetical protein